MHISRFFWVILTVMPILSACYTNDLNYPEPKEPANWVFEGGQFSGASRARSLKAWWKSFDDPVLNELINLTFKNSPDRSVAEARIAESRGLLRSQRSFLFPQFGFAATGGREDSVFADPARFYDARFDASYEVDIWGKNRALRDGAGQELIARYADYHDISLSLAAEVARTYIEYTAYQEQVVVAFKNLDAQMQILRLLKKRREFGEGTALDIARARSLVNATHASISELERQASQMRFGLSVLSGANPADIISILEKSSGIPHQKRADVLLTPAKVMALRPDVRAASVRLSAAASSTKAAQADIFPSLTLNAFYGNAENGFVNSTNIWSLAASTAVSLIDFGRIEGQIDAARAREKQAFALYKKTIMNAVVDVETALSDYARYQERERLLTMAFHDSRDAFDLADLLFREGETSYLEVLDAQRSMNDSSLQVISARAFKSISMVSLYKALGVY